MPTVIDGQKLRECRQSAGLSQAHAASLVRVSQPTWAKWENGTHAPRAKRVESIAEALDCDPTALVQPV